MLGRAFPEEYVAVIAGNEGTNEALLEERWDHIFFTGSQRTGRKVMEAAARNLTPVTLELGGKSPCIVDSTADLGVAARRIAWGKWLNCGQTCVAPDYCLVHRSALEPFLSLLHRAVESFYGQAPLDCPDYPHIVGERHYARLCGLLEGEKLAFGGQRNDLAASDRAHGCAGSHPAERRHAGGDLRAHSAGHPLRLPGGAGGMDGEL